MLKEMWQKVYTLLILREDPIITSFLVIISDSCFHQLNRKLYYTLLGFHEKPTNKHKKLFNMKLTKQERLISVITKVKDCYISDKNNIVLIVLL